LTKTEEEETIIINRLDRSTYPEQKSDSRSGATPDQPRALRGIGTHWYHKKLEAFATVGTAFVDVSS
jgi:hypothetical protein